MSVSALHSESACANPVPHIEAGCDNMALYRAHLRAKAAFELDSLDETSPDYEEIFRTHVDALNTFMLSPASSIQHLAQKLSVFQSEELTYWYIAPAMIATMAEDARRLSL